MRKETFTLRWKKDCQWYSKQISRISFHEVVGAIRALFYSNNEIATKLSRVIPTVDTIEIDMGRNMDMDIPIIVCICDEKKKTIEIGRNHKVIWSILEECCRID